MKLLLHNELKNLNPSQLKAVQTTEGYVRVIAGPGSGKTQTLIVRLAYLVDVLGIDPSHILCTTFTNKAAREMKNRIKNLCDKEIFLICTYHSFCFHFLRLEINKLNYPSNFNILDTEDQNEILREVYEELKIDSREFTFKSIIKFIHDEKEKIPYIEQFVIPLKTNWQDLPPSIIQSDNFSDEQMIQQKIFLSYLKKQIKNFALDFQDLINFTLFILQNEEKVLRKWQEKLHYILVDEAQDGSEKQYCLVELLAGKNQNLFLVGDPDQTIYEWRGANPTFLVEFDKKYPQCQTILLEQNYRSTPNILDLSNVVISKNQNRVAKVMFTNNPEGLLPVHFHGKNEEEENEWICKEIKQLMENGANYGDIAILYRASYLSRSLEQAFLKHQIPYQIYGDLNFFQRKEIKDIIAYLRFILYKENISLVRIINFPKRKLGPKYVSDLRKVAEERNWSLWKTLLNAFQIPTLARNQVIELISLIRRLEDLLATKPKISDLTQILLNETGILEVYRKDGEQERIENIMELIRHMQIFEKDNEEYACDLGKYLDEVGIYLSGAETEEKVEKVKLMTIHAAKGLEFPYVFLYGCTDGILPNNKTIAERDQKGLEEERRLAYVAITRAQKRIYLTDSEGSTSSLDAKYTSRFLLELPQNLYTRLGNMTKEYLEAAQSFCVQSQNLSFNNNLPKEGDKVIHPIWGEGIVQSIVGEVYYVYLPKLNATRPLSSSFISNLKNKA
ncbi:MAG: 3'-5' exonuclease [Bacteroidia bacterium]|nr:UvrD-helicase domain-containing protein [Bacteroidia bacterium]MDW8158678.1 3'-5' exonuclease [Bacteroidia bacterium]